MSQVYQCHYNDLGLVAQQVKVTTLSRAAVVDAAINRRIALERQAQRIRSRLERES